MDVPPLVCCFHNIVFFDCWKSRILSVALSWTICMEWHLRIRVLAEQYFWLSPWFLLFLSAVWKICETFCFIDNRWYSSIYLDRDGNYWWQRKPNSKWRLSDNILCHSAAMTMSFFSSRKRARASLCLPFIKILHVLFLRFHIPIHANHRFWPKRERRVLREKGRCLFFSSSAAAFSLLKGIGILKGDDSRAIITLAVSFGYGWIFKSKRVRRKRWLKSM